MNTAKSMYFITNNDTQNVQIFFL